MSVDDLLFAIIIGGVALSIAYLRAQYVMQRGYRIAERASQLRLRGLYATRANAQGPIKSPNAVLHGSLPVHVRFRDRMEKPDKSNPFARQWLPVSPQNADNRRR
jgi:hypothetical protein